METGPILATVKRWLRPLRPLLWPVWRRLTFWIDDEPRRGARAESAIARSRSNGSPIRPMTRPEFDSMVEAFPYYAGRWVYLRIALAEATRLIVDRRLRTTLELGAPVRPVIVGADVMDVVARPELDATVPVTVHDATVIPWPVADKAYDLFMALQVFEHLGDRQPEAFREVRRIARHAIISLPIDWEMDDPGNCHHRIPEARVLSWFAPIAPTRVIEGSGGTRRRLIYVFEDLAPL